jgi:hypothetical protein
MPTYPIFALASLKWDSGSAALLLLLILVGGGTIGVVEDDVLLLGASGGGGFVAQLRTALHQVAPDGFVCVRRDLPSSAWKISSMFLFYFAEHCIAPQKSCARENSSRNFLV